MSCWSVAKSPIRWRTERWDSLRLLTPNWQSRLPGFRYDGNDPDGYRTHAGGHRLHREPMRSRSRLRCEPIRLSPRCAARRRDIRAHRPRRLAVPNRRARLGCVQYRAGAELRRPRAAVGRDADGAILSQSGAARRRWRPGRRRASSSGTQIAHELQRSGRAVTLAVGEHIRAPRVYRGKDLEWWMDAAGVLDERYDQVDDIARARRVPSLQLAGTPDRSTLDLNCPLRYRREAGRPSRRHHRRRQGAVCRVAAQHVRALRSQDAPAARAASTNGRARTASTTRWSRRIVCRRPASRKRPRSAWTSSRAGSRRSSGPAAIGRIIPGWSCRFSTAKAWSA